MVGSLHIFNCLEWTLSLQSNHITTKLFGHTKQNRRFGWIGVNQNSQLDCCQTIWCSTLVVLLPKRYRLCVGTVWDFLPSLFVKISIAWERRNLAEEGNEIRICTNILQIYAWSSGDKRRMLTPSSQGWAAVQPSEMELSPSWVFLV